MTKTVEYTSWPLSAELTRKIVGYLNIYRMIITLLLGLAHFGGLLETSESGRYPTLASAALIAYLAFAAFKLFSTRREGDNYFRLASFSLILDTVFLSVLVVSLAGVGGGIGILLVFTCAVAAVLLPLRTALFLASIASLTMIGTAAWNYSAQYRLAAVDTTIRAVWHYRHGFCRDSQSAGLLGARLTA